MGQTLFSGSYVTAHAQTVECFLDVVAIFHAVARGAGGRRIAFLKVALVEHVFPVFIIVMTGKAFDLFHMTFMGKGYGRIVFLPVFFQMVKPDKFRLGKGTWDVPA